MKGVLVDDIMTVIDTCVVEMVIRIIFWFVMPRTSAEVEGAYLFGSFGSVRPVQWRAVSL